MGGVLSGQPLHRRPGQEVVPAFKKRQTHAPGLFPQMDDASGEGGIGCRGGKMLRNPLMFDNEGNVRFGDPVLRCGKQIVGADRLADRNASRVPVMNARADVDCQVRRVRQPGQG